MSARPRFSAVDRSFMLEALSLAARARYRCDPNPVGLVRSLAAQVGPRGIRVNAILPGFIDTPLNWVTDQEVRARIINRIPLRRAGHPEDVARTVLFLASDDASYVTGSSLVVDGGFTL